METASTASPRVRKRMPCEFNAGDSRHTGMVLNLSASGLFVQTNASLRPGQWIEIELPRHDSREPLAMRAAVVWRKVVPRRMHGTTHSGVGVELLSVPEDYRALVDTMLNAEPGTADWPVGPIDFESEATPAAAAYTAPQTAYRIRVRLRGAPRTRALFVEASNEAQACAKALNQAGRGWTVIEARCLEADELDERDFQTRS